MLSPTQTNAGSPTMSEPPNTSSHIVPHHHQSLPISGEPSTTDPTSSSSLARQYHKGNWTLQETLVLITAKKLNDERRSRGTTTSSPDPTKPSSYKTAELRWKWVENYCWNNNCLRSQNQCNDKWDNLLRDYKKVLDYETRSDGQDQLSYWLLEKHQRKDRHLPSNLVFEVFQALHDVVNQRKPQTLPSIAAPPLTASLTSPQKTSTATITHPPLPPPPPPPPPAPPSDSSETEGSGSGPDPERKRRRVRSLASSIVRSSSLLARTLEAREEKKEKRHRDVVELEERKIRIEENRTEHNRQGMDELITAVNNLSNAVHALVSDRHDTG